MTSGPGMRMEMVGQDRMEQQMKLSPCATESCDAPTLPDLGCDASDLVDPRLVSFVRENAGAAPLSDAEIVPLAEAAGFEGVDVASVALARRALGIPPKVE